MLQPRWEDEDVAGRRPEGEPRLHVKRRLRRSWEAGAIAWRRRRGGWSRSKIGRARTTAWLVVVSGTVEDKRRVVTTQRLGIINGREDGRVEIAARVIVLRMALGACKYGCPRLNILSREQCTAVDARVEGC